MLASCHNSDRDQEIKEQTKGEDKANKKKRHDQFGPRVTPLHDEEGKIGQQET